MSAPETAVIKTRSKFDRQLARIEQQVIWELSPQAPRDNMADAAQMRSLAFEAMELRDLCDTPFQKLRAISVAKDCLEAACRVRTGTVIDRTYPALQRVEVAEAWANLPAAESDDTMPAITDEEKSRHESIALMRSAIALLSQHGVDRPGLVLLRGNA